MFNNINYFEAETMHHNNIGLTLKLARGEVTLPVEGIGHVFLNWNKGHKMVLKMIYTSHYFQKASFMAA